MEQVLSNPFTMKETQYLRDLVEQEKIRLLTDISAIESRSTFSQEQKESLEKRVSVGFFDTENHVKKLKEAITTIEKIETVLYPSDYPK